MEAYFLNAGVIGGAVSQLLLLSSSNDPSNQAILLPAVDQLGHAEMTLTRLSVMADGGVVEVRVSRKCQVDKNLAQLVDGDVAHENMRAG